MNAVRLLDQALAAGIELIPLGSILKVRAPHQPPDDLLESLRQHKAELIALLDPRPRQYAYRYRLHDNEGGGTYLTSSIAVTDARDELTRLYGDRLLVCASAYKAGTSE